MTKPQSYAAKHAAVQTEPCASLLHSVPDGFQTGKTPHRCALTRQRSCKLPCRTEQEADCAMAHLPTVDNIKSDGAGDTTCDLHDPSHWAMAFDRKPDTTGRLMLLSQKRLVSCLVSEQV